MKIKRLTSILLCAIMALCLFGCESKKVTNKSFKDIGLTKVTLANNLKEYCSDVKYLIIDNNIAEINFKYNGHEYCFKGSKKVKKENLLSINEEIRTTSNKTIDNISFTFASHNKGLSAFWNNDQVSYALFGKNLNEDENYEFGLVALSLANVDINEYKAVKLPSDINSLTKDELEIWLKENSFKDIDWQYQASEDVLENHIIATSTQCEVYPENELIVYVSLGKDKIETINIPDNLLNSDEEEFIKTIEEFGGKPVLNAYEYYSQTIPKGKVFAYDDGTFIKGSKISYYLSKGNYVFDSSEYNGLTQKEVNDLVDKYNLQNANIVLTFIEKETKDYTAGTCYECSFLRNGHKTNVNCTLAVTDNKNVNLANYVGTYNNPCGSKSSCSFEGINYSIDKIEDDHPSGYILKQSVSSGSVKEGEEVTLTVSCQMPYLYSLESNYYDKFIGDNKEKTIENLTKKEALGLYKDICFEFDRSGDYKKNSIVNIYIFKDGEWTSNWQEGNYPLKTKLLVVIEE